MKRFVRPADILRIILGIFNIIAKWMWEIWSLKKTCLNVCLSVFWCSKLMIAVVIYFVCWNIALVNPSLVQLAARLLLTLSFCLFALWHGYTVVCNAVSPISHQHPKTTHSTTRCFCLQTYISFFFLFFIFTQVSFCYVEKRKEFMTWTFFFRWLKYVRSKNTGMYPALFTSTSVNNCKT